jgi:zinc protease
VIGSMADLQAASLDDVRNFFRTYYAPNNATIVIAGAISPAEARRLAEKWFGDIPRGPETPRNNPAAFSLPANAYRTLEDHVQLPRVYNAWHTQRAYGDDDATLQVLADILAGGRSSRLYRRLVYELQIANQVGAYHDALKMDGSFRLSATARPGHDLNELQREIDAQIRMIADSGPTVREVQRVQNQTEAQFLDGMETVLGKADQLNQYQYFVGTPDYFQQDLERYRRVTPAEVQRVARQYLASAHRVVVSVVPQGRQNLAVTEGAVP